MRSPPLPPGFVLEDEDESTPAPPPGFVVQGGAQAASQRALQPSPQGMGRAPLTGAPVDTPAPQRADKDRPDLLRAAQTGLTRGAIGTMGAPGALGNLLANVPGLGFLENPYGFQGAEEQMRMAVGPQFQPEGRAEEATSLLSEFVPGMGAAGAARRSILSGTTTLGAMGRTAIEEIPVAGGAVAGQQATFGSAAQPYAELGGALMGGAANVSTGRALPNRAEIEMRFRAGNFTPQQWSRAEEVARRANEMGFPIGPDEALKSDSLGRVAQQVMQRPGGRRLAEQRQARLDQPGSNVEMLSEMEPGQFRQVMQQFQRENLSRAPSRDGRVDIPPQEIIRRSEEAADTLRQDRSAQTRPFYQAARERTPENALPVEDIQALDNVLENLILDTPQGSPGQLRLEEIRQRLRRVDGEFENNAGVIDQVYREVRDRIELPAGDPRAELGSTIGVLNEVAPILRELTARNPNIRQGRELHAQFTNRVIRAEMDGPLGIIARQNPDASKRMANLAESVLNNREFTQGELNSFLQRMSRVDGGREATEGLLRGYLQNLTDKATEATQTGQRANPSAFFSSQIQGDARRNLNQFFDALDGMDASVVDGVTNPRRRRAFDNLLAVMDSTQTAAPPRGMAGIADTAFQGQMGQTIRRTLSVFRPLMTPGAVLSQRVGEAVTTGQARNNWQRITDAMTLTGPEGVRAIRRMADAGKTGPAAILAANELLAVRGHMAYTPGEGEDNDRLQ